MTTQLKYSTIVIALVTAVLIFVPRLPIRGIWTVNMFSPTLWGFWLGWAMGGNDTDWQTKKPGSASDAPRAKLSIDLCPSGGYA